MMIQAVTRGVSARKSVKAWLDLKKKAERLKVTVVSARGLRNADHFLGGGKSDPYCVCEIPGKPRSKFQTGVIQNELNPVWNHEAVVAGYVAGDSLTFYVWDKDFGKKDDFLGWAALSTEVFHPDGFEGEVRLNEAGQDINAFLKVKVKIEVGGGGTIFVKVWQHLYSASIMLQLNIRTKESATECQHILVI